MGGNYHGWQFYGQELASAGSFGKTKNNVTNSPSRSTVPALTARITRALLYVLAAAAAAGAGQAVLAATPPPIIPPPPAIAADVFLLVDATTMKVLAEQSSHDPKPPASLTKIMTGYVTAAEIEAGRIKPSDEVLVSVNAWQTEGSSMFIREGTRVSIDDLLKGVIIQSGNDASIALAEHIAGSESAFADMMNQQAIVLGMTNTNFVNSTGLPADGHQTSAWDLVLLTRDLVERFPQSYALYAERSFEYGGIKQPNRNRLLWRDRTVDGVKTGHTQAAGYCLVASALRNNMRLISVVMGTSDDDARVRESQKLLSYGFRYFETQQLYAAEVPLRTADVWYGETDQVELGVIDPVVVTFPRGHYDAIAAELTLARQIEAPVVVGEEYGTLTLKLADEVIYTAPLVALAPVAQSGLFSRIGDFVYLFFSQLISGD